VRARQEAGVGRVAAVRADLVGAQPPLHRPDLELALADVAEVLGRPQEHVDDNPERPEQHRGRHAYRDDHLVFDAAAGVLAVQNASASQIAITNNPDIRSMAVK
jgi:hypothetical protein